MSRRSTLLTAVLALAGFALSALADDPPASTADRPAKIFLVGDSTVQNGSGQGGGGLWGWGKFLGDHLDPARVRVENRARGGRSSRTYLTEGLWDKVVADLHPGDFVLIQFGHNDGGPLDTGRARASLKGSGDESKEIKVEATGKAETVHSYGWYLKRYIADARGKGATPVILSPVPRNIWGAEGKISRASKDHGKWAAEAANAGEASFVDLNEIIAVRYEADGREKVAAAYFTAADHTHTTEAGARVNAECVARGLAGLGIDRLTAAMRPISAEK